MTEQSLSGLDETICELNTRVENIDLETRDMVRSQVRIRIWSDPLDEIGLTWPGPSLD